MSNAGQSLEAQNAQVSEEKPRGFYIDSSYITYQDRTQYISLAAIATFGKFMKKPPLPVSWNVIGWLFKVGVVLSVIFWVSSGASWSGRSSASFAGIALSLAPFVITIALNIMSNASALIPCIGFVLNNGQSYLFEASDEKQIDKVIQVVTKYLNDKADTSVTYIGLQENTIQHNVSIDNSVRAQNITGSHLSTNQGGISS